MRYLLLPLFTLQLIFTTLPSLLNLVLVKISPYKSIIFSSIIFFLLGIIFTKNLIIPKENPIAIQTRQQILALQENKQRLETLLKKQPTHRDILYNLYLINKELGQTEIAQSYLQKARNIDPNNQLFSENIKN